MKPTLSPELYWLVLTTLMTGLFWIPYILQRILERGFWPALWDPQGVAHMDAHWAKRMMRAHLNAVENLAIFAPLVLALSVTHTGTSATATACMSTFLPAWPILSFLRWPSPCFGLRPSSWGLRHRWFLR